MKKRWKIFWIVCGATTAVGILCCAVSLALGVTVEAVVEQFPNGIGWVVDDDDYRDYNHDYVDYGDDYDYGDHGYGNHGYDDHDYDEHYESGEHTTALRNRRNLFGDSKERYSAVRDIDIEVGAGKIEVLPYDGDNIEVETVGVDKKIKLYSYMEEDTLKLETNVRIPGTNGLSVGTIYLRVPKNLELSEVSVDVGVGELKMESIAAQELSIEVGAGKAEVNRFRARKADVICGTGEVFVAGNVDAELSIENGIGSVVCNVDGDKEDYSYELEGALGSVMIGGQEYSGIGVSGHKEGNGGKQMDIECGLGEIVVNFTHS